MGPSCDRLRNRLEKGAAGGFDLGGAKYDNGWARELGEERVRMGTRSRLASARPSRR